MPNPSKQHQSSPIPCPNCDKTIVSENGSCDHCGYVGDSLQHPMNTMDFSNHDLGSMSDQSQSGDVKPGFKDTAEIDNGIVDTNKTSSPDATYREDVVVQTDAAFKTEASGLQSANYDSNKTYDARSVKTVDNGPSGSHSPVDMSGPIGGDDHDDPSDTTKTVLSDHHRSSVDGSVEGSKGRSRWGKVWKDIADSDASPMMTIKTEEVGTVSREGMAIQQRILRQFNTNGGSSADYEVIQKVGEGSMGQVFTAMQSSIQRTVAVKTLKPKLASKAADREKFLYEAMITGDLDHPNIVPIHDLGVSDDGTLFYSMKHVTGTEWQKVLTEKTVAENVSILMKVADAVAFAHSRRVIHRDLKPENIMLGQYGEVLVMDWGLAVNLGKDDNFTRGGTPAFMAPEMASHNIKKIDHRSDVYLLGAILYQLVIGYAPHPGRTVHECITAATKNIIIPVKKQDELLDIAFKAMATSPADRYQNVAEFQDAIREYQKHNESITFSDRGNADLQNAENEEGYESYSRAVFAFQDAIELWPENTAAHTGLEIARIAYAKRALEKEDYDLGLSLVDSKDSKYVELYQQLEQGAEDQRTRKQRLKFVRRLAVALGFIAICGIALGGAGVAYRQNQVNQLAGTVKKQQELNRQQKEDNEKQKIQLDAKDKELKTKDEELGKQQELVDNQKKELDVKDKELDTQQKLVNKQKSELDIKDQELISKNLVLFAKERVLSYTEKDLFKENQRAIAAAELAKKNEITANKNAARAEANEMIAQLGSYKSKISLADQYIDDGKVGLALNELDSLLNSDSLPAKFRGWELYRQYQLCNEDPTAKSLAGSTAKVIPLSDSNAVALTSAGLVARIDASGQVLGKSNFDKDLAERIADADLSSDKRFLAVSIKRNWKTDQFGPKSDLLIFDLSANNPRLISQNKLYENGILAVHFDRQVNDKIAVLGEPDSNRAEFQKYQIKGDRLERNGKSFLCGTYERNSRTHAVTGAAFSRSGNHLALLQQPNQKLESESAIQRCVIVDLSDLGGVNGRIAPIANQFTFPERSQKLSCAKFIPSTDENTVVCGTDSGLVIIWNFDSGSYRYAVGHRDTITDLSIRTGANRTWEVLTSSEDGRLNLWDGTKGVLLDTFIGHKSEVTCCAFLATGNQIISGDSGTYAENEIEGTIRHWQPGANADRENWNDATDVNAIQQVNEDLIVTGNALGQLKLHNLRANKVGKTMSSPGHKASSDVMFMIPRNRQDMLITCSSDNTTRVWSLDRGHMIRTLSGTCDLGYGVVSADGTRFYSFAGSEDLTKNQVQQWDLNTGAKLQTFNATNDSYKGGPLPTNRVALKSFVLSPDGRYLFTWHGARGQLEIWDTQSENSMPVYKQKKEGERFESIVNVFFDTQNERAIVQYNRGSMLNHIKLYSLTDNVKPLGVSNGASGPNDPDNIGKSYDIGGRPIRLVFERNGETVCVTETVKKIEKDSQSNNQYVLELFRMADFESKQAEAKPISTVSLSGRTSMEFAAINSGKHVVFLDTRGTAHQWDTTKSKLDKPEDFALIKNAKDLAASSDGQTIILGNESFVKAFHAGTNTPFFQIESQPACAELSESKDGDWIVSRHVDRRLYIHKIENSGFVMEFGLPIEQFCTDASCSKVDNRIAFIIDQTGTKLLKVTFDGERSVIEELITAEGDQLFHSVACHPNKNEIAIGSQKGTVLIVNVDEKAITKTVGPDDRLLSNEADQAILDVQYSPDGRMLISNHRYIATALFTANWTSEVFGRSRSIITSMTISRESDNAPQRVVLGRASGQAEFYLVDPAVDGFANNDEIQVQRSSDVFTLVANEEQKPIKVVTVTHDGRQLLTATPGTESVTAWFTQGWNKPKNQTPDPAAISRAN